MPRIKTAKNFSKSLKIMLLGSGELGKEFVIAAQRLGLYVIAVDSYPRAPAMQLADQAVVMDMLDGPILGRLVKKLKPDYIVPEIEALRTSKLLELEKKGFTIIPSAKAVNLTMNRDEIRDLAAKKLNLKTAKYAYAQNLDELKEAVEEIGYPNVIKPVMSSSGKGQSIVKSAKDLKNAWKAAIKGMRGDKQKVIVEEFIKFQSEITLLTVKQINGPTRYCEPIGHRQERGDYQESWLPAQISDSQKKKAQTMAKKVTDALGGAGLFGVEFFLTENDVYFSELSPRPHDTGMVTLTSQNLNQFELHLRAILGLPIGQIEVYSPSASAVILADKTVKNYKFVGLGEALKSSGVDVRLFGKQQAYPYRRMGVALARGGDIKAARGKAKKAARAIKLKA